MKVCGLESQMIRDVKWLIYNIYYVFSFTNATKVVVIRNMTNALHSCLNGVPLITIVSKNDFRNVIYGFQLCKSTINTSLICMCRSLSYNNSVIKSKLVQLIIGSKMPQEVAFPDHIFEGGGKCCLFWLNITSLGKTL